MSSDVVSNGPFRLSSPAFEAGGEIPRRFTCEGEDIAPELAWTPPPPDTKSLAFFIADPDAPDPAAPKITWTHEVVYDLPVSLRGLPEGRTTVPDGARDGTNDWKRTGYGGPCPPIGRHRYVHTLLALDIELGDLGALTRPDLLLAAEGHIVDTAVLIGTYEKTGQAP